MIREVQHLALSDPKAVVRDLIRSDLAFQALAEKDQRDALYRFDADWQDHDPDRAALAAMRLAASAGNGHTRVYPKHARGIAWRMVWLGERLFVTAAPEQPDLEGAEVVQIDGVPVDQVLERLAPWLAGSPARQRAISGQVLAWPAALQAVGLEAAVYAMEGPGGGFEVAVSNADTCLAPLYPMRESGFPDLSTDPYAAADRYHKERHHFRFVDCHDPEGKWLPARARKACVQLEAALARDVILDLRGNRGGSFFMLAPLVDLLVSRWRGARLTVLVDKYTFSAAIVTAFRLAALCPNRTQVTGEEMGDTRTFWAEGDFTDVEHGPHALTVRHSDLFYDWQDGRPDPGMPDDIRACLLKVPQFEIVPGGPVTAEDLLAGRDPWLERV